MVPRAASGIRAALVRTAALAVLWTSLLRQGPAVTRDGALADPAQRLLAALLGEPERLTIVAALPVPGDVSLAALKGDAERVARRTARALGVESWRLGNRVEPPVRAVFMDGRTDAGEARVVAWHDGERRGAAVVVVQAGVLPDVAAARRSLARTLAAAFGRPPSTVDTSVEVRGFIPGRAPPDVLAQLGRMLSGTGRQEPVPPVAVRATAQGSRVVIGTAAGKLVSDEILGEVVW
ncbi:MAG TPA: hypothetical protein VIK93_07810 [Limnochordales bacterium]